MSAIAGLYNLNHSEPVSVEQRNGMMTALEKFPADDIQVWQKGPVFLGCHAQWITPESIGEQLPFYDSERQCAITADCIIDNREELFEALQVPRVDQKTIPDSLLILLAYYKWGEGCPKHLIGDFAFMIWDEKERKMFGARDPSGYRTLYYFKTSKAFGFCTTIEPLLTLPYIKKELNETWLAEFLAISGMTDSVDACSTPYMNIDQIPPFHSIICNNGKVRLERYGLFSVNSELRLKSNSDYVEAFKDIFEKAVSCRLRTYKNVGSLLSGGLDSGSVVGFAARLMKSKNRKFQTFSYIPPSDFVDFTPKYLMPDERPLIKKTVEYVGGISDYYFDFENRDSYNDIDEMLEIMEMPYKFLENSFWLKGMFEKVNENGIGILLNGDRGNFTISWGQSLYFYSILLKKIKWIRLYKELNLFSANIEGPRFHLIPHIAKLSFPIINKILNQRNNRENMEPFMLINPEFANETRIFSKLKKYGIDESGWFVSSNIFEHKKILFEDMFPWNAGNTLNTKLSLSYKLWKRDPTNDTRVVRFCLSIPEDQYVQNGFDRALIRRSTEKILPDEIRLNQVVRGVQGADWVHRIVPYWDKVIEEISDLLSNRNQILKFINGDLINSVLENTSSGPQLAYRKSDYSLLMRSIIVNRFINQFS